MRSIYTIKAPVVTEKSLNATKVDQYTFLVARDATKHQIKAAIESQFQVEVVSVRTHTKKGLVKRTGKRRIPAQQSDTKTAIVQIKPGQKIDLFETQG